MTTICFLCRSYNPVLLSLFMTNNQICNKATRRVSLLEHELSALPKHISSYWLSGFFAARSQVLYLAFCRPLFVFCPFSVGQCIVCPSVGQCIVCPSSVGQCIVCPSSFGQCIVCPSSVGQCIVCPSSFGRCIVCPFSIYPLGNFKPIFYNVQNL